MSHLYKVISLLIKAAILILSIFYIFQKLSEANFVSNLGRHIYSKYDVNRFPGDLIQNNGVAKRLNPSFGSIAYAQANMTSAYEGRLQGRKPGDPQHPATRSFQALRIAVNRELDELSAGLLAAALLSGASGQVPITVANDLDQSVVVRVQIVPSAPVRLRIAQPSEIRLGPHKKETVEVSARAATSGTVPIAISLLTSGGERYDTPVVMEVRSTAYSRVGLAVVAIALAALALLVAARLVRRVRSRNAA